MSWAEARSPETGSYFQYGLQSDWPKSQGHTVPHFLWLRSPPWSCRFDWRHIELPLLYAKKSLGKRQRQDHIHKLLQSVGLEGKENDYPTNLSGGEQQRVAIARALVVSPEAILCDEPTGALDKKTGQQIMSLLLRVVKENKIMLLLVTHDPDIAHTCDTIFRMDEGRICYVENDS